MQRLVLENGGRPKTPKQKINIIYIGRGAAPTEKHGRQDQELA